MPMIFLCKDCLLFCVHTLFTLLVSKSLLSHERIQEMIVLLKCPYLANKGSDHVDLPLPNLKKQTNKFI